MDLLLQPPYVPSFAGFTLTFGVSATVKAEGEKNAQHFKRHFSSIWNSLIGAASVEQQRVPFFIGTALTFSFVRETFLWEKSTTAIDKANNYTGSNLEIWTWVKQFGSSALWISFVHRLTCVRKSLAYLERKAPVCAETALAFDSLTSKMKMKMKINTSTTEQWPSAYQWEEEPYEREEISPFFMATNFTLCFATVAFLGVASSFPVGKIK